jgi:toxin-antitoxin system PIN domain toxin
VVLPDVNVLVFAHRKDTAHHDAARRWVEEMIRSDRGYGMSELVVAAFIRIVTHPRVFNPPSPLAAALAFAGEVMTPAHAVRIAPGVRHWEIFVRLCRESNAKGSHIADAYLAALAIESGCDWVSTDGDYARFNGLVWVRPF